MSGNYTDEQLAARTLAGDRGAFRALVDRNYTTVYRLCRSVLHHSEDAEDATQEVFLRAYHSLGQFHGRGSFHGWLRRLTVNYCLNRLQTVDARRARSEYSLDSLGESISGSREDDPEDRIIRREESSRIQEELNNLPPKQRAAMGLRLLEGMSYEEIASTLGVPVNSVRSWLHRGRERMKEVLEEALKC